MSTWPSWRLRRRHLLRGVGYESNDASVLTNVAPTISTCRASIRWRSSQGRDRAHHAAGGRVVLNADDRSWPHARATPGSGHLLHPPAEQPRRHLSRGGRAVIERLDVARAASGQAIVHRGGARHAFGLATHNVANPGGDRRCDGARRPGAVADGLRAFQPGAIQTPGRLSPIAWEPGRIVTSPTTKPASVSCSTSPRHRRWGRRSRPAGDLIVGTAGNRNDTLRASRASPGSARTRWSSRSAYLRGRSTESVVGEFQAGLAEVGVDAGRADV